MDSNEKLTVKQARVIPYLLASPSIEEGCKLARVSKAAVYEWLRDETFRHELKRQHDAVIERAQDSLKANINKATETLVKLLDSDKAVIQARAAEDIIEFTQKALEYEDLEKRIRALEGSVTQEKRKS